MLELFGGLWNDGRKPYRWKWLGGWKGLSRDGGGQVGCVPTWWFAIRYLLLHERIRFAARKGTFCKAKGMVLAGDGCWLI